MIIKFCWLTLEKKKSETIITLFFQLILEKKNEIQCQGYGGYPRISNMSASIKERTHECNDSEKTDDCFYLIKELQVTYLIFPSNTTPEF